ncbi:hypothetical protein OAG71_03095 [bacterium]|nr:hypothetical protein [bacterium]
MAQQEISAQVDEVRKIVKPSLARFAKCDADQCTESYMFSSDRFCGMKIRLGAFEADWRLGSNEIQIIRGGHVLETLSISDTGQQRKAA